MATLKWVIRYPRQPWDAAAVAIAAFVEKPDLETARKYVASKGLLLEQRHVHVQGVTGAKGPGRFVPDIVAPAAKPSNRAGPTWIFSGLTKRPFAACPSDSIDYAVMEKTDRGAMLPMAAGWNDLGSWEALWQVGEKDDLNNVVKGDVVLHDVGIPTCTPKPPDRCGWIEGSHRCGDLGCGDDFPPGPGSGRQRTGGSTQVTESGGDTHT
jgi:mannose-1-phosphate guanylyltransferase